MVQGQDIPQETDKRALEGQRVTLDSGSASSMVREGFLEEGALVLDQGRRERRHFLERAQWVQGTEAGASLACSNTEGGRG